MSFLRVPIEDKVLSGLSKHKILVIILIILLVLLIVGDVILGIFFYRGNKENKNLKQVISSKSNCEVCPVAVEAVPETNTNTTTNTNSTRRRSTTTPTEDTSGSSDSPSSSSSTTEPVIPPPPPPSS